MLHADVVHVGRAGHVPGRGERIEPRRGRLRGLPRDDDHQVVAARGRAEATEERPGPRLVRDGLAGIEPGRVVARAGSSSSAGSRGTEGALPSVLELGEEGVPRIELACTCRAHGSFSVDRSSRDARISRNDGSAQRGDCRRSTSRPPEPSLRRSTRASRRSTVVASRSIRSYQRSIRSYQRSIASVRLLDAPVDRLQVDARACCGHGCRRRDGSEHGEHQHEREETAAHGRRRYRPRGPHA